jgi:hypothetical protein
MKKHDPYSGMEQKDLRLLCKKQAGKIDVLKLRLKKAEHLLDIVLHDKVPKKRITPAIPRRFKPGRQGGNPPTN